MRDRKWIIQEKEIGTKAGRYESLFSLANGKIGIRGFHDFLEETWHEATIYMNRFYDSEDYIYGEGAYGYAKKKQKMLPLPHRFGRNIVINGTSLTAAFLNMEKTTRKLDMEQGTLETCYYFDLPDRLTIKIEGKRFVSLAHNEVIWQTYTIEANQDIQMTLNQISSTNNTVEGVDPRLGSLTKKCALHIQENMQFMSEKANLTTYITDESKLFLAVGEVETVDDKYAVDNGYFIPKGNSISWQRMLYFSDCNQPIEKIKSAITDVYQEGITKHLTAHQEVLNDFWATQSIEIDNTDILQSIYFNMFHLFQHVGKDGKANICAKGLSGEGYEGHYFWDTEIYVLPVFIYTMPEIAKKLLISRFQMLGAARKRAKEMSYEGALYAWRTINGEEASAYYPAGTAQIHINADIAYAINQYYQVTLDTTFMKRYGIEMLIEIARFFADYADYIEGKGWTINGVTGPDEYHALINNDVYTNLMVKKQFENLLLHYQTFSLPGVTIKELKKWGDIAANIYIRKEGNLIAQDELFFERSPWDFQRRDKRPLLLHYHPMLIYKHQVLKQADLILAMLTCHEEFTMEEIQENYEYYEPLTTHDSSLSETIHGIIAAQIGKTDIAFQYFKNTVITDLYDTHDNTKDGVHIAAMAGGWQSLVFGFGGLRLTANTIHFTPIVAKELMSYAFTIMYRGVKVRLQVNNGKASISTDKEPENFTIALHE